MFLCSVIAVRKKAPQLTVVPVQTTNIPPKEVVLYTKQTQTTATGHELRDGKFRLFIWLEKFLLLVIPLNYYHPSWILIIY